MAGVIDVREDGQPESETDYETCMMCGNEKIRYVHIMEHTEVDGEFRVGCTCAEKMTNDYYNPKRRETELRNRANRRVNWVKKHWKPSKNGNHYLNIDGHHLVIYKNIQTKKFKVKIGDTFGKKEFDTFVKAKIAAFNGMEYLKDKGKW
ncbi:MAG: hypothetical protein V4543_07645 [Bacteroidota bacterium]